MPILETLDASQYDASLFYDADLISVGESYARLAGFVAGTAAVDLFKCDAGTLAGIKRAAARLTDQSKSRHVTWTEIQRMRNGRKVWTRLAKSATPKTNDTSRDKSADVFSPDDIRAGVKTLRESVGVAIRRQAVGDDGTLVVALVRSSADHVDNES